MLIWQPFLFFFSFSQLVGINAIKALPAAPHLPRPYGMVMSFLLS
jgi:hypothetical protein